MTAFWIEIDRKNLICEFDSLDAAKKHALAVTKESLAKITTMVGGGVPNTECYWDDEIKQWVDEATPPMGYA